MADDTPSQDPLEDGIWVGDWFVEPMLNRVRHESGEEAQLEPKVMEVLLCLAKQPGKTVTKKQFKEEVWTDTVVTDDVLSRCISELRKVFDDDSRDPTYIETIRKTGYRLIADVRVPEAGNTFADDSTRPSEPEETHAPSSESQGFRGNTPQSVDVPIASVARPWRRLLHTIATRKWIVVLGILVGIVLLISFVSRSSLTFAPSSSSPRPATPLTSFPGEEFDPALSKNGQQAVFAWRNADSLHQNIYLMQQGADRPLRLSADTTIDWSPAWSPTGRFVAYVRALRGEHQIAVVPSIGGRKRIVARMSDRRIHSIGWAPDTSQTKMVMSAQAEPHQALRLSLLFPGSDSVRTLTTPPLWSEGDMMPVFSPDGSKIAFVRGLVDGIQNVFVVPTEDGSPSQVTNDSTSIDGVAWTQDGNHLIYSARRDGVTGIWRIDSDGGTPSLVRAASEGTRFRHPSVSEDRLAYTQQSAQLDIWMLRRSGRSAAFQAEEVISSTQEDKEPSLSPNGNRIAFISERSGSPELWVADLSGAAPTQLTTLGGAQIHSVTWSSDNEHLCFVARRNGQSNLFVVPVEGGPLSQITDTRSQVAAPRWSADNEWIYFSSTRTGAWEIWRTTRTGSRVQQVSRGGGVAAQEGPNGSSLYLVRPDTVGIWSVNLDTSAFPIRMRRTTLDDQASAGDRPAAETPLIAPPSNQDTSTGPGLARRNAPPSLRQVIADFDPTDRLDWRVAANGIYFLRPRRFQTTVLSYFDFTSGRTVPLYTFPDWKPGQQIAVGPRGDTFAYTHISRRQSDVMVVEFDED